MNKNQAEFTVVNEECYFCGQLQTVRFAEHYIFCPNCAAIYTEMIVQESRCEHIKDGVPCVENTPRAVNYKWVKGEIVFSKPSFGPDFSKPYIYEVWEEDGDSVTQHCSVCGEWCIADGW